MILITIARTEGSTPRETGAQMQVWTDRIAGTIGGGAAEMHAIATARAMLERGETRRDLSIALGPDLGQCCGGRLHLRLDAGARPAPEPPRPAVRIFGAGPVGRALARGFALLPVDLMLIDQRPEQIALAPGLPGRLTPLPEAELRAAPPGTAYLIATHDHALDFLLAAEALARRDAAYIGMIGSATKRAVFARQLPGLAPGTDAVQLTCPIGTGPRDKRPEIIAAFTIAEVMARLLTPERAFA